MSLFDGKPQAESEASQRTVRSGPVGPATDLTKWRLHCEKGRQRWFYEEEQGEGSREQNFIECHSLGLDMVRITHHHNILDHLGMEGY